MRKKIIAIVLAVALIAGLVGGGVYWKKSRSGRTVNVYAVMDLSTTYWGDDSESSGMVSADHTQSVYLSDTQTVKNIAVEEGQEVKKGDVLMTYDTTLSDVEVEKKDLEIQKLEISLKEAKSNLSKVQGYKAGVPVPEEDQIQEGTDFGLDDTDDDSDVGADFDDGSLYNSSSTQGSSVMSAGLTAAENSAASGNTGAVSVDTGVVSVDTGAVSGNTGAAGGIRLTASGWKGLQVMALSAVTVSGEDQTEASTEEQEESESSENPKSTESVKSTEDTEGTKSTEVTKPSEETKATEATKATEDTKADESSKTTESTKAEDPDKDKYPKLLEGKGSKKKPYIYEWKDSLNFTPQLLEYLSQGKKTAIVMLQPKVKDGEEASWWKIKIKKTDRDGYTFEMLEMCVSGMVCDLQPTEESETTESETEETGEFDDPDIDPDDGGGDDNSITYTSAEIADLLAETTEQVKDLDLELRTAQIEYEKMKKEVDNGEVVSEFDGVIRTVRDADEAKLNGEAVIDVSGGGGYYVDGSISELELDSLEVGQTVSVMSYETYESYEGTVTEISDYPLSNSSYYYSGAGNSNVSYYTYTVFVDEDAELQDGEYVGLTLQAGEGESGSGFYLDNSMIRKENGKSYVYVENSEGKLEKRTLVTGKGLWGAYTEILSGLTQDDFVAFPYGSSLKDGAPAVEADISELYNY